jgi:cytidylate kinase
VIIIGYGGFQATRELPGGIDVRLVAPLSLRAARMASELGENEAQAARTIQKRDDHRRRMLKTHYQVDSSNPELYDMVFNTEHLSTKSIASVIVQLIKSPEIRATREMRT